MVSEQKDCPWKPLRLEFHFGCPFRKQQHLITGLGLHKSRHACKPLLFLEDLVIAASSEQSHAGL